MFVFVCFWLCVCLCLYVFDCVCEKVSFFCECTRSECRVFWMHNTSKKSVVALECEMVVEWWWKGG